MFILNWDFDVVPITFDENCMLCSLIYLVYHLSQNKYTTIFRE